MKIILENHYLEGRHGDMITLVICVCNFPLKCETFKYGKHAWNVAGFVFVIWYLPIYKVLLNIKLDLHDMKELNILLYDFSENDEY